MVRAIDLVHSVVQVGDLLFVEQIFINDGKLLVLVFFSEASVAGLYFIITS